MDRCLQACSQEIGSERNDLAAGRFSSALQNNRAAEGKKEGRIGQLEMLSWDMVVESDQSCVGL